MLFARFKSKSSCFSISSTLSKWCEASMKINGYVYTMNNVTILMQNRIFILFQFSLTCFQHYWLLLFLWLSEIVLFIISMLQKIYHIFNMKHNQNKNVGIQISKMISVKTYFNIYWYFKYSPSKNRAIWWKLNSLVYNSFLAQQFIL